MDLPDQVSDIILSHYQAGPLLEAHRAGEATASNHSIWLTTVQVALNRPADPPTRS
jgi:hypothetical protein